MAALDDAARKWTDAELEALERNMRREYAQAAKDMRGKQAEWLDKFNREREMRERALDSTKEAMDAHKAWLRSQAARSDWLDSMVNGLSESAHQANVRAVAMVNDHIPRVFSENANRAAFAIEGNVGRDMGFTLVNEDAVRYLMGMPLHGGGGGQLVKEVVEDSAKLGPGFAQSVRKREIDAARDIRWNRQKFTSAITQGILQGESIPSIVKRTESIFGQNLNAATRAARTATTNAENAGRMASFERAEKLGIDMEIEWQATLDERTRESHRQLDGERIKLGESFETEDGPLRWPGDPLGPDSQVWNCRCRADGRVVGFDGERGEWADDAEGERWARLPEDMTYDEWMEAKAVSRDESYENEAGRLSFTKPTQGDIIEAESSGFEVDELHPENVGGVSRTSEAMSFDDANELRGNPRYVTITESKDAFMEANEEYMRLRKMYIDGDVARDAMTSAYDKALALYNEYEAARKAAKPYTVNCQTCVVANEARRRGYDVMATGNVKGSVNERLSYNTRLAWIDPSTGTHPSFIRYDGDGKLDRMGRPIPTKAKYWKWLNDGDAVVEGNRYTIEFSWKGRSSAHIVSIERVDGSLRLYDPQNGESFIGDKVKKYLEDVSYYYGSGRSRYADGPKLLRVDNMRFNSEITDAVLEARA